MTPFTHIPSHIHTCVHTYTYLHTQLFAAPPDVKESLFLEGWTCEDFEYTNKGDTETRSIEGVSDGDRFVQTMEALDLLGVTEHQRIEIQRILGGILYLGQVCSGGYATSAMTHRFVPSCHLLLLILVLLFLFPHHFTRLVIFILDLANAFA